MFIIAAMPQHQQRSRQARVAWDCIGNRQHCYKATLQRAQVHSQVRSHLC